MNQQLYKVSTGTDLSMSPSGCCGHELAPVHTIDTAHQHQPAVPCNSVTVLFPLTTPQIWQDSWVITICVPFLFMPSSFARLGCVSTGLVYPASCCASVLRTTKPVQDQHQDQCHRHGHQSERRNQHHRQLVKWLKYWVVYGATQLAGKELERRGVWRFVWFGDHLYLLMLMFLQLPYFRGAVRLYDHIEQSLRTLLR